ncbi:MAG: threonine synthase [Clostridia bacterium]|nr:threonine synthase [Clostridia bacterium]
MQYNSTRNNTQKVTAQSAMKEGLSREGGLYVPESFPLLTQMDYNYLINTTYVKRTAYILNKFLDDFSLEELENYAVKAYGNNKFGGENPTPLYHYDDRTAFLELWHGPTCAFKDMALQMLPHLLTASVKKTGDDRTVCILVATSGDTGKAALDGFSGVDGAKIIVFYPKGGVSEIQRLQMVTQKGDNVLVCGVDGNFDDAQTGVKTIFTDEAYNREQNENGVILSSANSINWGRLVPQVVYYISAYCDLVKANKIKLGDTVNVCVPTGNFGNILAAYYAKKMGLPLGKLICASNRNNVLTDFINTGVYNRKRDFVLTMSPSMDILISSNLERYLYDISGKDDGYITTLMDALKNDGIYEVTPELKETIKADFYGGYATEEETLAQIAKAFSEKGYLMDTHTAVAASVLEAYRNETGDNNVCVVASTASPYKFNQSVLKALGVTEETNDEFARLETLKQLSGLEIPNSLSELKTMEKRFTNDCKKEEMIQVVTEFLKQ